MNSFTTAIDYFTFAMPQCCSSTAAVGLDITYGAGDPNVPSEVEVKFGPNPGQQMAGRPREYFNTPGVNEQLVATLPVQATRGEADLVVTLEVEEQKGTGNWVHVPVTIRRP